jgi:hypothetical protein
MRDIPVRERVLATAVAVAGLLVVAWLGIHGQSMADWQTEARPAVSQLLAGHVHRFLALAPIYGGSLIIRAPFMLVTKLWHGGDLAIYTASAVPALAALGVLGLWLFRHMRVRGGSMLACLLALLLCVANPLIVPALEFGHPEDILGTALCVGAVLCALDDRPVWAGVLVGLAIPNKEWALVAIGPMLVALPRRRILALLIAGAVAGALIAPFMLGVAGGGVVAQGGLSTGEIFQPWQLWWWLGSLIHTPTGALSGYRWPPGWVETLSHPLIIGLVLPMTGLYAWRRRGGASLGAEQVLLLLALLLALRCALDPWDISYYSLPFLVALLTWEVSRSARPPVVTLAAVLAAWFVFRETTFTALNLSGNGQALVFTIVAVPALVALTVACYAPGLGRRLVPRARRARPVPDAAPA